MTDRDSLLKFLDKESVNLEDVIRYANNCSKVIDLIKAQLYANDDLTLKECAVIVEHFELYKNSIVELKKFFRLYDSALSTTLIHLKPSQIKWTPDERANLKMKFKAGSSPWLLHLTYCDPIDVSSYLNESYTNGELKPLSKVSKMDFVCCKEDDKFYRAVILDIGQEARLKTLYFVDEGTTDIVSHMDFYEIPVMFCDIPVQCMQCMFNNSLTDQDKVSWPEEMGEVFQYILSNLDLSVSVVAEKHSFPPVYLVDIIASGEQPRSLNEWLSTRLLPNLERLEAGYNAEDFLSRLQADNIFDPFYTEPQPAPPQPIISRIGNALLNFFSMFFNPPNLHAFDHSTAFLDSTHRMNYFSFPRQVEASFVGLPIPYSGFQGRRYRAVMRSELPNATMPEVNTVMVVRILRIITMRSAYILMPIKYSVCSGDKKTWAQLNDDLNVVSNVEKYEAFTDIPIENELVIAKSSGGIFRRAKVLRIMNNFIVEVFYIDHGFSESLKFSDLRVMHQQFMDLPAQVVKTNFDFSTSFKAIAETSVVLVTVLKCEKVGDEMELTVKANI